MTDRSQPSTSQAPAARVLITGAGTGIGRSLALRLSRDACSVVLAGRRRELLEAVAEDCRREGGTPVVAPADVSDHEQVRRLMATVRDRLGALDGVVNNAGRVHYGSVEATPLSVWNEVLAVNLTGVFLVTREALPLLRMGNGPSIVNVSSNLGLVGFKNAAAYAASKAGVVNLTRAVALDHAEEGIRCNAVCPGVVNTEMARTDRGDGRTAGDRMRDLASVHPLGRIAEPEEIAATIAFLLSERSSFLTGAAIPVDGGSSAGFTS